MPVRPNHTPSVVYSITDTALVESLWQGDLSALGLLYDRYASLVYTTALRSLGDVANAEDLTQDVFLTLTRQHTYDPERGPLSSYLTTLTRSRAIDRLRAQTTRNKYHNRWQQHPHSAPKNPIEHVSQRERNALVRQALTQLSKPQRQVLELSYYQGQSQSEIARQLNVPLGTVKSWARRGLLKLRSHLQDPLSEELS